MSTTLQRATDGYGYDVIVDGNVIGQVWKSDQQMDGLRWVADRTSASSNSLGTTQDWFVTRWEAVEWLTNWYEPEGKQ